MAKRGKTLGSPQSQQEVNREESRKRFKYWMDEIEAAKKVFKDYFERGRKIIKVYKDERKRIEGQDPFKATHRLNILWSNVQTLQPALYSRTPMPNVARRFLDRDPTSRIAALIAERNLMTAVDLCDFDYPMKRSRDDYLLVGRGLAWVRYTPEFGMVKLQEPVAAIPLQGTDRTIYRPAKGGDEIPPDRVQKDEDGMQYYETEEEGILAHGMTVDHVLWTDFLHEPVNDWTKVGWAAKRALMKRPKLIKFFGEDLGRQINLTRTFSGKEADERSSDEGKRPDCAEVWEIWSKDERKVCWISDGYQEGVLKEEDDPLKLSGFWPFPRPLLGTTTTDSLIPVPDYALYQDQAEQLDRLTDRIRLLINALRVVGLYNGESADLSLLLNEGDENEMIPVQNWVAFANQGGMKGNIDWLPIEQIQAVLMGLFNARAAIKQDLYEITGISDIIRGATAPEETATAQQIKANFGNLRLQDRQGEMSRFARDVLRIMAEVQCEHYPDEVLLEMSGVTELDEFKLKPGDPPEKKAEVQQKVLGSLKLLRQDKMRSFRIDVETDATVAPDQQKEKETRVEFLTAVAPFLEKAAQVGTMAPQLVPLLMKMLEFGVRGFRAGRTLESAIEETISLSEQMQQQAQQAGPQQPPPDPQAEAMAAKLKAETDKINQELARLTAQIEADKAENERKRLEAEERRERERQAFQQSLVKLTEEINARRLEHEKQCKVLELQIAKATLELEQLHTTGGVEEIRKMLPEDKPELSPDEQAIGQAETKAKLAEAQVKLAKLQTEYAELVKRSTGLNAIGEAVEGAAGEVDPGKIGTPVFAQKKKRTKKMHQFIRDPETGAIIGGTTDELEIDDEDGGEQAA